MEELIVQKKDWKIGDVRGVLEVVMPIHEEFVLSSIHTRNILIFMLLVILSFIIHYTILYLLKQKRQKEQTKKLQDEVEKQTKRFKKIAIDYFWNIKSC